MREPRSISHRRPYGRRAARRHAAPDVPSPLALVEHLADLREAVSRHAAARRAEGVPLAQVLAEISDVVELAERLEGTSDGLGLLVGRVRLWGLAAYVDEPELRHVPRFY